MRGQYHFTNKMPYKALSPDIGRVPLELKYSSGYFSCPCGTFCLPRCFEILMAKVFSKMRFLSLSDYHLNVYSVKRGSPYILLETFFVQSVHIRCSSMEIDNSLRRHFELRVYRDLPQNIFTIHCYARNEFEVREWQRSLLIFQQRERKAIIEAIKQQRSQITATTT